MRLAGLVLLLLACEPTRYPLPQNALRFARTVREDDGMRVTLTPVSRQTAALAARLRWRQSPLTWGVALREKEQQDVILPLVPLPSLQVTIENQGAEPIRFSRAEIRVEDAAGRRYQVATRAEEYLPRVLDQLLAQVPDLWFLRLQWGPTEVWPAYMGWNAWNWPVMALIDAAKRTPLLGPDVVVPPQGRWVGALVILGEAKTPMELAERMGTNLKVSWSGVESGERTLVPQHFTLVLDGRSDSVRCEDGTRVSSPDQCPIDGYHRWRIGGPCVQIGERSGLRNGDRLPWSVASATWVGGTRVTNSDLDFVLRDLPESRKLEERSRSLRAGAYTLMLGGVLAGAATPAAIAGAGYSREAPAGVAAVAVSGIGGILYYLSLRAQDQAVRAYNRQAFLTGACSAPL